MNRKDWSGGLDWSKGLFGPVKEPKPLIKRVINYKLDIIGHLIDSKYGLSSNQLAALIKVSKNDIVSHCKNICPAFIDYDKETQKWYPTKKGVEWYEKEKEMRRKA